MGQAATGNGVGEAPWVAARWVAEGRYVCPVPACDARPLATTALGMVCEACGLAFTRWRYCPSVCPGSLDRCDGDVGHGGQHVAYLAPGVAAATWGDADAPKQGPEASNGASAAQTAEAAQKLLEGLREGVEYTRGKLRDQQQRHARDMETSYADEWEPGTRRIASNLRAALAELRGAEAMHEALTRCQAPTPAPATEPPRCGWNAAGCQGTARHMVTRTSGGLATQTLPMCDRCASIHDPALGATSSYSLHDFVRREPIVARAATPAPTPTICVAWLDLASLTGSTQLAVVTVNEAGERRVVLDRTIDRRGHGAPMAATLSDVECALRPFGVTRVYGSSYCADVLKVSGGNPGGVPAYTLRRCG